MNSESIRDIIAEEIRSILESQGGEGSPKTLGLFIKLPESLASKFPEKPEEPSPPHVTFLFIGDKPSDPDEYQKLIETLKREISEMPKFRIVLDGLDYFRTPDRREPELKDQDVRVVSHVKVKFEPEMRPWKGYLWTVLEKEGFVVKDSFPEFKPHVTLGYVDNPPEDYVWEEEVPDGSFEVKQIELWGHGEDITFDVGTSSKS